MTFSLEPIDGEATPDGATIDPATGVFRWTPPDNGVFHVAVVVTDDSGDLDSQDVQITVDNVAPDGVTIDMIGDNNEGVFPIGDISFSGSFTDVGTLDTHVALWTFTHVVGTEEETDTRTGVIAVSGYTLDAADNTYDFSVLELGPGVYTVTLMIIDDDTGVGVSTEEIFVVYDPSEGFVSGAGWINSPAGAYRPDLSLTGKANFGFVSKYKKGANVPTGRAEFQFKAADFNFHGEHYQWLVVAGARAQFKGTGTIQGLEGEYGFILTATDAQISGGGDVDKFRIKIWHVNPDDGDDESDVIYDNQFTDENDADPLALVTGNIVIHNNGQNLRIDEQSTDAAALGVEITTAALRPVVDEAIGLWQAAGVDENGLAALKGIDVQVAQLSGTLLGVASGMTASVWVDRDATGYGWSVDGGSGGVDLLSTLTHEFGHVLGLDHDVMGSTLAVGVRDLATSQLRVDDELHRVSGNAEIGWRPTDEAFEMLLNDVGHSENGRGSFGQRHLQSRTAHDRVFETWYAIPIGQRKGHRRSLQSTSSIVAGEDGAAHLGDSTMDEEIWDELIHRE